MKQKLYKPCMIHLLRRPAPPPVVRVRVRVLALQSLVRQNSVSVLPLAGPSPDRP